MDKIYYSDDFESLGYSSYFAAFINQQQGLSSKHMMMNQYIDPQAAEIKQVLLEHHVPQQFYTALYRQITTNQPNVSEVLKGFKAGGRIKSLESQLKNNSSFFKCEDVVSNQRQTYLNMRNQVQSEAKMKEEDETNVELCKMITQSAYFKKKSQAPDKCVKDMLQPSQGPLNEIVLWGVVLETSSQFSHELIVLAQNKYREALFINIVGKSVAHQSKIPEGFDEQTYGKRWSAITSIKPGDIICAVTPSKSLTYEAYCQFNVFVNQVFIIRNTFQFPSFFEKYDKVQRKPTDFKDDELKKKQFQDAYQKVQLQLWSEQSFFPMVVALNKYCYCEQVLKFCKIFSSLHWERCSTQTRKEVLYIQFVNAFKISDYEQAYFIYKEAQKIGETLDTYKEELIQLLYQMKEFEEVKKKWDSLEPTTQQKMRPFIEQTNLILEFKNEGKRSSEIFEVIRRDQSGLVPCYYGPIEIKQASVITGRKDEDKVFSRGVFLTRNVKKRELLWAERDLSYSPSMSQQNNYVQMNQHLTQKVQKNDLLRLRVLSLSKSGAFHEEQNSKGFNLIELYSNDKFDYSKYYKEIPQFQGSHLLETILTSAHVIYPKPYQSDQYREEEGLWPIFSFVNHSVSNRNIELKIIKGFLFVYSTVSIPKGRQLFYNDAQDIHNEEKIKEILSRYSIEEH